MAWPNDPLSWTDKPGYEPAPLAERRRAKYAKYSASPKGRARAARYNASPKGRAYKRRTTGKSNAHRIFIGNRYVGRAKTGADAAAIARHIKDRLDVFITGQQARAQAQTVSAVGVSVEAGPRADRLRGRRVDPRDRSTEKRTVGARPATRRGVRHHS